MGGRIDPCRDCHNPSNGKSEKRKQYRQHQPLADQISILSLILQRITEIPLEQPFHPEQVPHVPRLIKSELFPERFHLFLLNGGTARSKGGDVTVQKVAGRRLHEPENNSGKKDEQYREDKQALDDKSQHANPLTANR